MSRLQQNKSTRNPELGKSETQPQDVDSWLQLGGTVNPVSNGAMAAAFRAALKRQGAGK